MTKLIRLFYLVILFALLSCSPSGGKGNTIDFEEIIPIQYAKGLSMYKTTEGTVVTITNPQTNKVLDHFLVSKKAQTKLTNIKVVKSPFNSVLAYSSTYISFLDALGEADKVTGVSYAQGIQNKLIRKRLENNKTIDVGSDQNPDKELILSLKPNLAMVYPANGNHDWFQDFGIPTITNIEYLETHPLAQAEWIKLYGVLFDKLGIAQHIFDSIALSYNQNLCQKQSDKPIVLCGELYDNTWTLPGGKSTTSQLIKDAGGEYFYSADTSSGSKKLDFEYVLSKDSLIDYWLLLTYNQRPVTYSFLKENYQRYSYLSVFNLNKMAVCNTAKNTYFESGILEPHVLLREIKALIHGDTPVDSLKYFIDLK